MKKILPITLDVEAKRPLIVAFAVADVTAGTLLAVFDLLTDHSGLQSPFYFAASLIFGIASTVLVIVLLALPVFVVFHRLRCITLYSALLAGAVIGGAVSYFFNPISNGLAGLVQLRWSDKPTQNVIAFSAIGLFSALA